MKKIISLTIFLFGILVPDTFAQTTDMALSMKRLIEYSSIFSNSNGTVQTKYARAATSEARARIRVLDGDPELIDIPLEIGVLSRATGVINIRPAEAVKMYDDDRQLDLQLGAKLLKRIYIGKFLGDDVGRFEGVLQHDIIAHGNVSRADIEAYYRSSNGIRALISETIDEEFNEISFRLANSDTHSALSYSAVLTRNPQNGQYVLSYGGTYTNEETRTITANSPQALSHEMRTGKYKADFDATGIRAVETQATLIPAVRFGSAEVTAIKDILTAFYLNPNTTTYNAVRDVMAIYNRMIRATVENREINLYLSRSYNSTLGSLSRALSDRVIKDVDNNPNLVGRATTVEAIARQLRQ
jgi:hypothetical protein